MNPQFLLTAIIRPAHSLLGPRFESREAEVLSLAIALEETSLTHRYQIIGPARSYWQFEISGVKGVIKHPQSRTDALRILGELDFEKTHKTVEMIHGIFPYNDHLAAAFARLLLWTDVRPLPSIGDEKGAYAYYISNWRPGKPSPESWATNYKIATETVAKNPL